MRERDPWWSGRSTVELMVLALTVTVCLAILLSGVAIVVIEIVSPETDTNEIIGSMSDVLSMILGALLGLLAGRSDQGRQRPDGTSDGL